MAQSDGGARAILRDTRNARALRVPQDED